MQYQNVIILHLLSDSYAALLVNGFACQCISSTLVLFIFLLKRLLVAPVPSESKVCAAAATVAVHGIFYAPVSTERSASCLWCAS